MDKKDYKLAYDYIYNLLNLDEESMKWPLTIDSMSIFKELVDEKLNNPTLEQVKQEWGNAGYVLCVSESNDAWVYEGGIQRISFYTDNKNIYCRLIDIPFKIYNLMIKTTQALGWI